MFNFFKRREAFSVVKLFKIVDNSSFKEFNLFELFELNLFFFDTLKNNNDFLFFINYASKPIIGFSKFKKQWSQKVDKISAIFIMNERERLLFVYGNPNADLKNPKPKNHIEINFVFYDEIDDDFVCKMLETYKYDWGYAFMSNGKHDIVSENKVNIFTNTIKTGIVTANAIHETDVGYIPNFYPINFLNPFQLVNLKRILVDVVVSAENNGLYEVKLTDREISMLLRNLVDHHY